MALDAQDLKDALADVFAGRPAFPASTEAAAQRWATAYREYASGAQAGPTAPLPPALDAAGALLASAVATAFGAALTAGPGGVQALAAVLDGAFVAFWLAPPVAFAAPLPPAPPATAGVVTLAPPGVLSGLLGPLFTAGANDTDPSADRQAAAMANALDGWTRTVMVTNTPIIPPGPPLPPVPLL